ncbi:MAG: methyltransferase domain-containing protein, partial [Pseudolabrys sp.]
STPERLFKQKWSPAIVELLTQQIREPLEEIRERNSIPAITPIVDSTSLQVRHQYEQNPYPRWTKLPPVGRRDPKEMDVLIAGCGTGKHIFDVAVQNPKARVLAIDISVASLAYAKRKVREERLVNIEFAQADILELGAIGRVFDHIGGRSAASSRRPEGRMARFVIAAAARRHHACRPLQPVSPTRCRRSSLHHLSRRVRTDRGRHQGNATNDHA